MKKPNLNLVPTVIGFSENNLKERITSIMKFRKPTIASTIASICFIAATTTAFATTVKTDDNIAGIKSETAISTPIETDNSLTNSNNFSEITPVRETHTISAVADPNGPIIRMEGDYAVLYEDGQLALMMRIDDPEPASINDYSEMTLVSTNEYTDSDYRYVDKIYSGEETAVTRSLKTTHYKGVHEVYYEPDNAGTSTHLATMSIEADFSYDSNQNIAYVDDETIVYTVEKRTNDTYPKFYEVRKYYRSNVSGGSSGYNYAEVLYDVQVYKSSTANDIHYMNLSVNSHNTPKVTCSH